MEGSGKIVNNKGETFNGNWESGQLIGFNFDDVDAIMNVHKRENDAVAAEKIGKDQKGKRPKKGKKKAGERWRRLLRYTRVKVSEEIIESVADLEESDGWGTDSGQEEFLDSDSESEVGVPAGVQPGKADDENSGKFFWEKDVKVEVPPKRSVSCKSLTSLKKSHRNDRLKMALNFQKK